MTLHGERSRSLGAVKLGGIELGAVEKCSCNLRLGTPAH